MDDATPLPTGRGSAGALGLALSAAALLALGAWHTARVARHEIGVDFYHFWLVPAAHEVLGRSDVYASVPRAEIGAYFLSHAGEYGPRFGQAARLTAQLYPERIRPTASPFLYTLFAGLRSGDYQWDYHAYQGVATLLFALGLAGWARLARLSWTKAWLVAGACLWLHAPVGFDVAAANTNRVQIAMLAGVGALSIGSGPRRQLAGGALMGLAILFKPNLLLAGLALVAVRSHDDRGRLKPWLVGLALGALLAVISASAYFGSPSCFAQWARQAPSTADMRAIGLVDFSFSTLARAWAGSDGLHWLTYLAPMGALALLALPGRGRFGTGPAIQAPQDLLALALGAAVPIVSGPLVWNHYHTLALPLLVVLLASTRGPRRWAVVGATLLSAFRPIGWFWRHPPPLAEAAALQAGLLLALAVAGLMLLGTADRARTRRARSLR